MTTEYNASEIDRLVREYQDRGRDFARRGGTWLGAARSWIKRHCLNGERVTWGSNDVLQHDFTVDDIERIALEAATAVFDEFAAMVAALSAAKAEVERLRSFEQRVMPLVDLEVPGMSIFHDDAIAALRSDRDRLAAEVERLRSIAEAQSKLLAELPPSADQLIMAEMAAATARAERDAASRRLSARVRELELTEFDNLVMRVWADRLRTDPMIDVAFIALLDRLVKGGR